LSMIIEQFGDYYLTALPGKRGSQQYSVGVIIERNIEGSMKKRIFHANDRIYYILEVEAAKEGINLGKNVIKQSMVGF